MSEARLGGRGRGCGAEVGRETIEYDYWFGRWHGVMVYDGKRGKW